MCLSLEKDGAETDLNLHSHVDRGRNMVFYYGLSMIGLGPLFVLEINPLSRSVHGCINLIFIILSILFNLFICINLVYFFVFLFNYFIYLNFTYSECNASKGLSHN